MSDPKAMAESVRAVRERLQQTRPAEPLPVPAEMREEIEQARTEVVHSRWLELVPRRFHQATLDYPGLPGPVRAELAAWAEAPAGRNLVLVGPVGTGKTSAAFAALAPLVVAGTVVDWAPQARLIDRLDWRRDDSARTLDALCAVPVLFVDDLASDRLSDWAAERLYVVLNDRWMAERPTVATTNLAPDALRDALGERSYSRLVGSDAVVLRLAGDDRRRNP